VTVKQLDLQNGMARMANSLSESIVLADIYLFIMKIVQ